MAEKVGDLKTITDAVKFLNFQQKRMSTAIGMWEDLWNLEQNLFFDSSEDLKAITLILNDTVNHITELLGAGQNTIVTGIAFELTKLRPQYACPLEAGKLFTNWNIATTTLTIEGEGGRIADIGTDTSNRFKANAEIMISKSEDEANNGLHIITGVSGLVITCSASTFTANTNDTSMIVTLIKSVA